MLCSFHSSNKLLFSKFPRKSYLETRVFILWSLLVPTAYLLCAMTVFFNLKERIKEISCSGINSSHTVQEKSCQPFCNLTLWVPNKLTLETVKESQKIWNFHFDLQLVPTVPNVPFHTAKKLELLPKRLITANV